MSYMDSIPAVEPVSLEEARVHLKLDVLEDGGHPEDALVEGLISAAREHVEQLTQTIVAERTVTVTLDGFAGEEVDLGVAPVTAINAVMYEAYPNTYITLPQGSYKLVDSKPAKMVGIAEWPVPMDCPGSVAVQCVAGYAPKACPKTLKQAMLLLVGHWYENRQAVREVGRGMTLEELPKGVDSLIAPHRLGMGL